LVGVCLELAEHAGLVVGQQRQLLDLEPCAVRAVRLSLNRFDILPPLSQGVRFDVSGAVIVFSRTARSVIRPFFRLDRRLQEG
jgi:hypothetical protein